MDDIKLQMSFLLCLCVFLVIQSDIITAEINVTWEPCLYQSDMLQLFRTIKNLSVIFFFSYKIIKFGKIRY